MSDETPKYEQVAYQVRKKIIQGYYPKQSQLPLERELGKQYGVSRITIKKAIDILVQEGLVVKKQGAGTFVKQWDDVSSGNNPDSHFKSFTEQYPDQSVSSNVTYFNIERVDEDLADKLQISMQEFVYHVERTRLVNGAPYTQQTTYIPINLLIGLKLDTVLGSLYEYAQDVGGIRIQSAHLMVSSALPTAQEKELLKMPDNMSILEIESTVFLDTGQIFEYTTSRYRSDRCKFFSVELR